MKKEFNGTLELRLLSLPTKLPEFTVAINGNLVSDRTIQNDIVEIPWAFDFGNNLIEVTLFNKDPSDTKVVDGQVVEDLAIQIEKLIVDDIDLSHNLKVNAHYEGEPETTTYGFMYKNGVVAFNFICPVFLYIRNLALVKN
jgi:hypothetical protein